MCIALLCTFLLGGKTMNIKYELLKSGIYAGIDEKLSQLEFDADKMADSEAVKVLSEIKEVLAKDISDFEMVEEIVKIFEKHHISAEGCHDF